MLTTATYPFDSESAVTGNSRSAVRGFPDIAPPFHDGFTCFAGDHWITGNRRVARILLNEVPPGLLSHLSGCYIPEECFYQTVLCNRPELRLSNDSKRYRDWSTKDCHPKTLGLEDIPAIQQSGAYFARKFDLDLHPETFDVFDRITSA
jgi:hypothetical protein